MNTCPLLKAPCVLLSPGMWFVCARPVPERKPFTAILPNGPASKIAGGNDESGPVMDGLDSGAGAAGAGAAAACAASGVCAGAGSFWAYANQGRAKRHSDANRLVVV